MKTLHTATPWTIRPFKYTDSESLLIGSGCYQVAEIPDFNEHQKGDADYIVKCVNSYEQLVEALKKLSTTSETMSEYSNHFMKNSIKLDYQSALSEAKRLLEGVSND